MSNVEAARLYRTTQKGRDTRQRAYQRNARKRPILQAIRYNAGCADCGTKERLHFHHLDESTKTGNVARMEAYGWGRILAEIDLCVVLCASCHVKRHGPPLLRRVG